MHSLQIVMLRSTCAAIGPPASWPSGPVIPLADPKGRLKARAEWYAEWRDDLSSFIARQEIEAAVDRGITVRPPQAGIQYQSWVDASSGSGSDSFTCSIGHRVDNQCIVDHVIEIKPPFQPSNAVAEIATTLRTYNIRHVTGDRWGLGFVESEFRRHGIEMSYSDKTRSDVYRESLPVIRSGRARLLDHPRMVNQYVALERRTLPGGGEKIDHPQRQGHHDDVSNTVSGLLCLLSTELSGAEPLLRSPVEWAARRWLS